MSDWQQQINQGELQQAKEALVSAIKQDPKNATLRSAFIEVLCLQGDFERADEQLMQAIKLFPEYLAGASQIRHLVKAAQARVDFAGGAASAQFVSGNDSQNNMLVSFSLALLNQDGEELVEVCEKAEAARPRATFSINGQTYEDVRDLDDRLAGFIELFSSAGNYFLVPLNQVNSLQLKPATNLLENIWRPCEFDIDGLGEGEAHFPMTYVDSATDQHKLGRETDWKTLLGTEHCLGMGQKMWLAGEGAIALSQLQTIERVALAATE
ncbi:type VI secretion system accessory protein TagJ [Vibrio cidicii]|uniref:type VI secretion system accessory protein TagJ n=1 Tax=Vibrio cidicii TaxID=1763883 RepID=UPI0018C1D80B|nr:type VI secretion system accessory protein TagJ [Vibrio cidicii]MBG0760994.1 protein of avirulence locus [Vibrio cidicii]